MNERFYQARIRIRYDSDKQAFAGCAIRLNSRYVVTCTHVLQAALGKGEEDALPEGQVFAAHCPHDKVKPEFSLKLLKHYPPKSGTSAADIEDLALLEIVGETDGSSDTETNLCYPDMYDQITHEFYIYSTINSEAVTATCTSTTDMGWLSLAIANNKQVKPGDSGSPVFNTNLKAITGILVARKTGDSTCYVIPASKIQTAFSGYFSVQDWQPDEILAEDDEYLQQIAKDIEADLRHSAIFCEKITSRCSLDSSQPDGIKHYMLSECDSGNFTKLLSRMRSASLDAADEIGSDNYMGVNGLLDVAHDVASKLVVFNIEAAAIRKHKLDCLKSGAGVRGLPNMSNVLAPAFAARSLNATAGYHFKHSGSCELEGNVSVMLDSGFSRKGGSNDVVNRIVGKIFAKVMDKELSGDMSNEHFKTAQLKRLNAMLKVKKEHDDIRTRRRYFLIIPDEVMGTYKDVLDKIRELVPDFLFFHITSDYVEGIFTIDDADIEAALIDYFTALEKLRPHEQ